MRDLLKNIKQFYLRNRVSDFEFSQVSNEVYRADKQITAVCSLVVSILFMGLFIVTMVTGENIILHNRFSYLAISVVQISIFIASRKISDSICSSTLLLYAFVISLFIYTISVDVFAHRNGYAVMVIVLEFGIPTIFIDRIKRFFIVLAACVVTFCFLTVLFKKPEYALMDVFNALVFLLLSLVPGFFITKIKINEFSLRQIIEAERDTDSLTRLLNKAAMIRQITRLMMTGQNGILIILDLDYFKQINDTYGHFVGDNVLKIVSDRIRQTFRSTDVLSRFGGDEFVIFMAGTSNSEIAMKRCNFLLEMLNKSTIFENDPNNSQTIHASLGFAVYEKENIIDFEDLFKKADSALYSAKKDGKDCVRQYDGKKLSDPEEAEELIEEL